MVRVETGLPQGFEGHERRQLFQVVSSLVLKRMMKGCSYKKQEGQNARLFRQKRQ